VQNGAELKKAKITIRVDDSGLTAYLDDGRPLHGVTKIETTLLPNEIVKTVIELIGIEHQIPPEVLIPGRKKKPLAGQVE
jgi:hypothetical protein